MTNALVQNSPLTNEHLRAAGVTDFKLTKEDYLDLLVEEYRVSLEARSLSLRDRISAINSSDWGQCRALAKELFPTEFKAFLPIFNRTETKVDCYVWPNDQQPKGPVEDKYFARLDVKSHGFCLWRTIRLPTLPKKALKIFEEVTQAKKELDELHAEEGQLLHAVERAGSVEQEAAPGAGSQDSSFDARR